jgi:hypothetical protein
MAVKRYANKWFTGSGGHHVVEDPEGEYVMFDDFDYLLDVLKDAEAEIACADRASTYVLARVRDAIAHASPPLAAGTAREAGNGLCSDCPPEGHPGRTRCDGCPRRGYP